jgi:phospholipid-binding lipoprotein MlaA
MSVYSSYARRLAGWLALAALVVLTGCATGPNANPRDPFEPFNRGVTSFNDGLDRAVLKPVATGYVAITPTAVRTGVTNFFSNLSDAWTSVNSALQLRPQKTVESIMRFSINTFFGFGGLLDIATEINIPKHNEDLGKTLGRWGVPSGPYVVLPILGPSTVRDGITAVLETQYDPVSQINPSRDRLATNAFRIVNSRANFLRLGTLLDDAALDKYSFTRDAYLAKRNADVARSANKAPGEKSDEEDDDKGGEDFSKPPVTDTPAPGLPAAEPPKTP